MIPLPPPGARLRLYIDALDDEGRGRAQVLASNDDEAEEIAADAESHGYDVAVRGASLGDEVECVVERIWAKRRLVQARVVKLLEPGPAHVDSPCVHGPPCPGCPLEGWSPSLALDFKRTRLLQALAEKGITAGGKALVGDALVDDVLVGESTYARRQRTKLVLETEKGRLRLGLYAPHSHRLVPAARCPHLRPDLVLALRALEEALSERESETAPLKAVIARSFKAGVGMMVVSTEDITDDLWRTLTGLVNRGDLASVGVRVDERQSNSLVGGVQKRQHGPARLAPLEGGPPVDLDAFCQPDPDLARQMYTLVATFLAAGGTDGWALDAYAGTGGFARALFAAGFQNVVAVERSHANLRTLEALSVEALAADIGDALSTLATRPPPKAIVADPPRRGLAEHLAPLAALGAERLVLISCDPDAMARDLDHLLKLGYALERIIPVDLFGGAAAIEAISLLTRS